MSKRSASDIAPPVSLEKEQEDALRAQLEDAMDKGQVTVDDEEMGEAVPLAELLGACESGDAAAVAPPPS
eukprot:gene6759-5804_t